MIFWTAWKFSSEINGRIDDTNPNNLVWAARDFAPVRLPAGGFVISSCSKWVTFPVDYTPSRPDAISQYKVRTSLGQAKQFSIPRTEI